MNLWRLIQSDFQAVRRRHDGQTVPLALNLLAVTLYRVAHELRRVRGGRVPARVLTVLATIVTGAELDPQAVIGPELYLDHTVGVIVGMRVEAGRGLELYGGAVLGTRGAGSDLYPKLGDDVKVYAKASVIGGVTVGDDAVVGAHSLVLSDVPPGAVARGVPARY